jgi:acyl carrier protein
MIVNQPQLAKVGIMTSILNVRDFIISEFIPDAPPEELTNDLDLLENGIVDSLGVLKIVAAIENELNISIEPELLDARNFATIASISRLIDGKRAIVAA